MSPFQRAIAWLKDHPFAADVLLASVLMVIILPQQWQTPPDTENVVFRDPNAVGFLLSLLGSAPLAWRRRAPLTVLALTGFGAAAYELSGFATSIAPFGMLVALYTVGAHCNRRESRIAAAMSGLTLAVVLMGVRWEVTIGNIISNFTIFGTAWLIGDNLKTRRAYVASLEERALRAEQTRAAEAQRAVAEERTRIARELHDVVAHSMSVMLVQTGAARRVLDTDPAQAAAALQAVEATGRDAMTEMRRLLGVLREDSAPASLAPQPSLAGLEALVAQFAEAGLAVTLELQGVERKLPAGIELSAYRIVQEALTNALKHAGPGVAVAVTVHCGDEGLDVRVLDDGRGAAAAAVGNGSGGHGVLGMRERVDVCGGELVAGPRVGGGFEVHARLPVVEGATG